jgi:tRNA threonylcarbamoyladenosine biosynthesis protein TsaE
MNLRARTDCVESTRSMAASVASLARPGDLLLLAGDLGAGKTAFTQGFGSALGIKSPITSPTFTLARQYEGRLRLHHLDVYRFERLSEVMDVGLSELLDEGSVVVIEWGDAIIPVLPRDFLEIRIAYGEGDDDRIFELRCVGPRWTARTRSLQAAVHDWVVA